MTPQLEEIQQQALLLSLEDRELLVDRLLTSLQSQPAPRVETAWIEEAERRYGEYKAGRVEGIPGEHIFDDIRRELEWQS